MSRVLNLFSRDMYIYFLLNLIIVLNLLLSANQTWILIWMCFTMNRVWKLYRDFLMRDALKHKISFKWRSSLSIHNCSWFNNVYWWSEKVFRKAKYNNCWENVFISHLSFNQTLKDKLEYRKSTQTIKKTYRCKRIILENNSDSNLFGLSTQFLTSSKKT